MTVSRQQQVIDTIRQMIFHGTLAGGDRLIETDLSQRLNISRTPVREALIALAEEQLVEYRKNRGYVVRKFELSEIGERYTVRAALEALACQIISDRGPSAELMSILNACLAEGDAILSKANELDERDTIFWAKMNDTFHNAIVEATGNKTLINAYRSTTKIPYAPIQIQWISESNKKEPFESFHKEHHLLAQALRDNNSEGAAKLMQSHILAALDYLSERSKVSLAEVESSEKSKSGRKSRVRQGERGKGQNASNA